MVRFSEVAAILDPGQTSVVQMPTMRSTRSGEDARWSSRWSKAFPAREDLDREIATKKHVKRIEKAYVQEPSCIYTENLAS